MDDALIIPVLALLMPLILVPTIMTMKHREKRRQREHQERMRRIDMGLSAMSPEQKLGAGVVIAIGGGVPAVSVLAAAISTANVPTSYGDYLALVAIIWGCTWLISMGALITSLVLGICLSRSRRDEAPQETFAAAKPAYDPDMFDVVASRG